MTDFNLHQVVADVLDGSDLASPEEIAARVAENVGSKQLRAALAQSLPHYVSRVIQNRRASNVILNPNAVQGPVANSGRSAKVMGIRNAWARALADRLHVADGYKLLGECTYNDLMFAAEERRDHARRNSVKADQYAAVAKRLTELGLTKVSELPTGDAAVLEAAA
jgi:hypothetical protein